jgi:hypothetical protein
MSTLTALTSGRIEFTPRPVVPTPQRGGRRPPTNRTTGYNRLRAYPLVRLLTPKGYRRARNVLQFCAVAGLSCVTTVLFLTSIAAAQPNLPLPDLAGTYKCEGDETACGWSGWTFTVTQSDADLEIKNEKGDIGHAKLTSRISLSAGPIWNMLGTIVSADNRVIQWSNGTTWRKQ